jgi:hypothetical protein
VSATAGLAIKAVDLTKAFGRRTRATTFIANTLSAHFQRTDQHVTTPGTPMKR